MIREQFLLNMRFAYQILKIYDLEFLNSISRASLGDVLTNDPL